LEELIMRKAAAVLSVALAFASHAENTTAPKPKSARFASVTISTAGIAGSYRGPADSYGLILEVGEGGTLRGNYVEMGRVAVLNAIVLDGSSFTARASFDDGSSRTLRGSFARRVVDGESAFGLRMQAVPVEGLGAVETFFERI
jgi:hypothetical protein